MAMPSLCVEHLESPGKLVISVSGIESLKDVADLDVAETAVTFKALGRTVCVALTDSHIDLRTCQAKFKNKRLEISWHQGTDIGEGANHCAVRETASVTGQAPAPTDPSVLSSSDIRNEGVVLPLRAGVDWALEQLHNLQVPKHAEGFDRFKAEVGLAELALYASRLCRLGSPNALIPQLKASEAAIYEALSASAAGEVGSTNLSSALRELVRTCQRCAGAVCDRRLKLTDTMRFGKAESTRSCRMADARWELRDGTLVGPGIGTWKLNDHEAEHAVEAALRIGVRHVDTAAEYGNEAGVGAGIRKSGVPADEVFTNLKVSGEDAAEIRRVLNQSYAKLGSIPVSCLMLHRAPSDPLALETVWAELEREVRSGRVKFLGCSNLSVPQLETLFSSSRSSEFRPALVQLKFSVFHQGAYFSESGLESLWRVIREGDAVAVGISMFNPLHSCIGLLKEPLIDSLAHGAACDSAQLLANWGRSVGVCPLLRCSPKHAKTIFENSISLSPGVVSILSGLSSLAETAYSKSLHDPFGLRVAVGRCSVRCGQKMRGRWVEVHGLSSSEHGDALNGMQGVLMGFEDSLGTWQVGLQTGNRNIRPENLALMSEETSRADAKPFVAKTASETAAHAGRLLQDLMATGGVDAMLRVIQERRLDVDWALAETVEANLTNAVAKGYKIKQQVLGRLLSAIRDVLRSRAPETECIVMLPPPLEGSVAAGGCGKSAHRLASATVALLEHETFAVCDDFAPMSEIAQLSAELGEYDEAFETAKIWVGKDSAGTQLSVPAVRSDRILWVCGEHKTALAEHFWDSAGQQPASGLAPCKPEVVMTKSTAGFPRLTAFMRRLDEFVLNTMSPKCARLSGLTERSDAMISLYDKGSRFQKHVDNPNKDGRFLTSILYLNSGEPWTDKDGGELRIFPKSLGGLPMDIAPKGGRLVLFWADQLAHEVLPAKRRRMALTYWWFDRAERVVRVKEQESAALNRGSVASQDERLAQEFIAFMLGDGASVTDVVRRARKLPPKALNAVAAVVGASNGEEAMQGLERLSKSDLQRLRGSMGKMGLA